MSCLAVGELKISPTGFRLHTNDDERSAADDIQELTLKDGDRVCACATELIRVDQNRMASI